MSGAGLRARAAGMVLGFVAGVTVAGGADWPDPPPEMGTFTYDREKVNNFVIPFFPPGRPARESGLRWPPKPEHNGRFFGLKYTAWGAIDTKFGHRITHPLFANGDLRVQLYRVVHGERGRRTRVVAYVDGEHLWRAELDAGAKGFQLENPFLPKRRIEVGVRYPDGEWLWGRVEIRLPGWLLVGGPDFREDGWADLERYKLGPAVLWRSQKGWRPNEKEVYLVVERRSEGVSGSLRREIVVTRVHFGMSGVLGTEYACAGHPGGAKVKRIRWFIGPHEALLAEGELVLADIRYERPVATSLFQGAIRITSYLPRGRDEWPEPMELVYECALTDGAVLRRKVRMPVANVWFVSGEDGGRGPLPEDEIPWKVGEPIPVDE